MKKLSILIIFCLFFLPNLYARGSSEKDSKDESISVPEETIAHNDEEVISEEKINEEKKKGRRQHSLSDRKMEITLFHADVYAANNFISIFDVFKETIVLNLDDLSKGLRLNAGANVDFFPTFRYRNKLGWGFGLNTKAEVCGIVDIAGELLSLQTADNAKSAISGAAFASGSIDAFFPIEKFTLKIKPTVYYTLMYVKPDINYTFNKDDGVLIDLNYDLMIYTPFPLDSDMSIESLSAKPGVDLSLGLEFPISRAIGLYNKIPFLDFDIGIDIKQIPIVPSSITDYKRMSGKISNDDPFTINEDFEAIDDFFDDLVNGKFDSENGSEKLRVTRPFKTMLWTAWRPIGGRKILTLNLSVGFEINKMYVKPFSMEGGLNATFNFGNIFIIAAGVNYTDRMWVNSLDFTLNFRAFQLDFGANMRSQDFVQSWKGSGVGARVGMKFGW